MNYIITKIFLVLLVAGLLTSCSTAAIKETWRSPTAQATAYKKLLVVGVANDDNLRRMFEDIFVQTLRDHGVPAVPSHTFISDIDKADSTQVAEAAKQAGADAVIITRVASRSESTNYQYATGEIVSGITVMEKSGPNSSTTVVMSAAGIAPHTTDFEHATLRTNFFDAASARLVWSAQSSVFESDRRATACWDLAALLVKALGKDRMIEVY